MEQRTDNEGGPTNPHAEPPDLWSMQRPTPDGAEPQLRGSEHELSTTLRIQKKARGFPVWIGTSAVLLFFILVLGGWKAVAKRERRPVGSPVPTDPEGLKGTLDALDKAAERLRIKWGKSSEKVRVAFNSFYSPSGLADGAELAESLPTDAFRDFPEIIDVLGAYVDEFRSTPLPDKNASKEEKEDYAMGNLVLLCTVRAATTRLGQLAKLERVANEHPGTGVYLLSIRPVTDLMATVEEEEHDFSFTRFVRQLEVEGIEEFPPQKGSGPTAPETAVNPLVNAMRVKHIIESHDMEVFGIFQELLDYAEQAKFGRDSNGKSSVDNLSLPHSELAFPMARFALAFGRSSERAKLRRTSACEVLGWQKHWNVPGLHNFAQMTRSSVIGSVSLQQYERLSAISAWSFNTDPRTRLLHPFAIAISLL